MGHDQLSQRTSHRERAFLDLLNDTTGKKPHQHKCPLRNHTRGGCWPDSPSKQRDGVELHRGGSGLGTHPWAGSRRSASPSAHRGFAAVCTHAGARVHPHVRVRACVCARACVHAARARGHARARTRARLQTLACAVHAGALCFALAFARFVIVSFSLPCPRALFSFLPIFLCCPSSFPFPRSRLGLLVSTHNFATSFRDAVWNCVTSFI